MTPSSVLKAIEAARTGKNADGPILSTNETRALTVRVCINEGIVDLTLNKRVEQRTTSYAGIAVPMVPSPGGWTYDYGNQVALSSEIVREVLALMDRFRSDE